MSRRHPSKPRRNGAVDHADFASDLAVAVPGTNKMEARDFALAFTGWIREQLLRGKDVTLHKIGTMRLIARKDRQYHGVWRLCGPRVKLTSFHSMKRDLLLMKLSNDADRAKAEKDLAEAAAKEAA